MIESSTIEQLTRMTSCHYNDVRLVYKDFEESFKQYYDCVTLTEIGYEFCNQRISITNIGAYTSLHSLGRRVANWIWELYNNYLDDSYKPTHSHFNKDLKKFFEVLSSPTGLIINFTVDNKIRRALLIDYVSFNQDNSTQSYDHVISMTEDNIKYYN